MRLIQWELLRRGDVADVRQRHGDGPAEDGQADGGRERVGAGGGLGAAAPGAGREREQEDGPTGSRGNEGWTGFLQKTRIFLSWIFTKTLHQRTRILVAR